MAEKSSAKVVLKADQHYHHFLQNIQKEGVKKAFQVLAYDFLDETEALLKQRGVTDSALPGVLNEMNIKWKSLASKDPRINENGYKSLIQKVYGSVEINE